jgi:hypothetical protein
MSIIPKTRRKQESEMMNCGTTCCIIGEPEGKYPTGGVEGDDETLLFGGPIASS